MTKKEMVYEIISNTKLSGLSERHVNNWINKISKSRVEEVYNHFLNNKENAYFYYCILVAPTIKA